MAEKNKKLAEAIAENEELRARLQEAEEASVRSERRSGRGGCLRAKRRAIYTLSGAERSYRILVEAMNEGALVLSPEGVVIYCNRTFVAMLGSPIYEVLGNPIYRVCGRIGRGASQTDAGGAPDRGSRREMTLKHTTQIRCRLRLR